MIDLNCDLGEGEPSRKTRSLLRWVTSASIACGGHAGDERTLRRALIWCRELGVNAGAHPGFEDPENFGRRAMPITPGELKKLLTRQACLFAAVAKEEKVKFSHLKLHGALYHAVERDPWLARAYVDFVRALRPRCRIFALPNGRVLPLARRHGVEVWGEIYADRGYTPQGDLVSRGEKGAVLHRLPDIRTRVENFLHTGTLAARDGTSLRLDAQTLCVHADSPDSGRIARLLANVVARRKP